jgi:hypothetical protein
MGELTAFHGEADPCCGAGDASAHDALSRSLEGA